MFNQDQPKPPSTKPKRHDPIAHLTDEQRAYAHQIATHLGETKDEVFRQFEAVVGHFGVDYIKHVFDQTLEIEANGGMLIVSGKRRRTPGGVFLFLMSQQMTLDERKWLLYRFQSKKKKKGDSKGKGAAQSNAQAQPKMRVPSLAWDWYHEILNELIAEIGAASNVKITLIGRPGAVRIQSETAITTMQSTPRGSSLPKGVPNPPQVPTLYTVYLAVKQWRKVEEALQNPDDVAIIEGTCGFDPEANGMVVYTTNVTTKLLEAAKRESKGQRNPSPQASPAGAPPSTPRPLPAISSRGEPPAPRYPIPPKAPPEAAKKLQELHLAAEQFRQKLVALEKNPPDQRPGYAMTQKLLKNTEDQITALEKRYQ